MRISHAHAAERHPQDAPEIASTNVDIPTCNYKSTVSLSKFNRIE